MKILAIDYSLNSPAFCVSDKDSGFLEFTFVAGKKSQIGKFETPRCHLHGVVRKETTTDMARYLENAKIAMDLVGNHGISQIYIEGYSYGSKSSSFSNLVENTAVLKLLSHQKGITLVPFAPGAIKKFGSGKGNSNKIQMEELGWRKSPDYIDFMQLFGAKIGGNPASDIIDAYFIAKLAESLM